MLEIIAIGAAVFGVFAFVFIVLLLNRVDKIEIRLRQLEILETKFHCSEGAAAVFISDCN